MNKFQSDLKEFFERCLEMNEKELSREEELTLANELNVVAESIKNKNYDNILEY